MLLLGPGPDGHVGCLFPDSAEIKASRAGKVALARVRSVVSLPYSSPNLVAVLTVLMIIITTIAFTDITSIIAVVCSPTLVAPGCARGQRRARGRRFRRDLARRDEP